VLRSQWLQVERAETTIVVVRFAVTEAAFAAVNRVHTTL